MANKYSDNYTKAYVSVPSEKIPSNELSGQVKVAYCEYQAAAVLTAADVLYLCKLPKGARVVDALVSVSAGSYTAGAATLGYLANGSDLIDADAFLSAAELEWKSAAVSAHAFPAGLDKDFAAGWMKELGAETDIVITITETSTAADCLVRAAIHYILD